MSLYFTDKYNKIIELTKERIKHIYQHPEMQNKLYLIENAITNSDFIEQDLYRRNIIYYYKYLKEERKYLMVVVKLNNNHGKILTSYFVEK